MNLVTGLVLTVCAMLFSCLLIGRVVMDDREREREYQLKLRQPAECPAPIAPTSAAPPRQRGTISLQISSKS